MKKICLVALSLVTTFWSEAQTINAKLDAAIRQLEKDAQLKHGLIGFSVIDAVTGKAVYERNAEIGLAPASTQKIFTSIAGFELLSKNYRYKTSFEFSQGGILSIFPSGDPTLGSWRFNDTRSETIIAEILNSYKSKGIQNLWTSTMMENDSLFESQAIPDGWIWEDIGNYYGTGHYALNWNENQYDLILEPGNREGSVVEIRSTRPNINIEFNNKLKTGSKGSGDNAYIYFEPFYKMLNVRGTIPCCVDSFIISGAIEGWRLFDNDLVSALKKNKLIEPRAEFRFLTRGKSMHGDAEPGTRHPNNIKLYEHFSPPYDSINYYFLKRSINLYGEAIIRTIAKEKVGLGSTTKGVELVKDFFEKAGIEKTAIDIIDGSGLSPQNRVTANSLTKALRYARSRPWFKSFYYALPEINGMKMKSGLIGGVRSYAGYQKAANGKEYIFSINVNNYSGSSSEIEKKLFKILDYLK